MDNCINYWFGVCQLAVDIVNSSEGEYHPAYDEEMCCDGDCNCLGKCEIYDSLDD